MPRRLHDLTEASPRLISLRTRQAGRRQPRLLSTSGTPPSALSPRVVTFIKRLCLVYMAAAFPAGLLPLIPAPWMPYYISTWVALVAMAGYAAFSK